MFECHTCYRRLCCLNTLAFVAERQRSSTVILVDLHNRNCLHTHVDVGRFTSRQGTVLKKHKEYAFGMGSKDHCQWPKNVLDDHVSPERQLRSCHIQLCSNCNQPIQVKVDQQNVCMCLPSTPTTSIDPISSIANQSKKKSKKNVQLSSTCKRQLFDVAYEESTSSVTSTITQESIVEKNTLNDEASNISIQQPQQQIPAVNQMIRGRHVCQICFKSFTSPCKLTQHSYSHTGEKPFVCKHCSKAFSSKFKLVRHVLIHSDQRQYHCTVCDRTFHRKDHLKNHAKVHNPIKRTLQCDRPGCSKEYSSVLSYRKHIAVHSVEEGFLDCKICNKIFESKDDLMFHLKIHSGSRVIKTPADKKYRCSFCDRSFYTGKDVRRHLVVHTGLRDFLCQFCPQRFGRKDHLTRHIKKSHNVNASKKSKPKKSSEHKSKSVEAVYLETYGQPYKVERKVSETVTSGSLIKQEITSPITEIQMFHSSDIASFNYSENNDRTVIQTVGSSSEVSLSNINYEPQTSYPVNELKVFDTTLTNQLEDNYQGSSSSGMPGLSQLINLIPPSTITSIEESDPSVLTSHNSSVLMEDSHQHIVSQNQTQYLTSSSEILSALLRQTSETSNTPLPGFNQVFHQQQ